MSLDDCVILVGRQLVLSLDDCVILVGGQLVVL